MEIVFISGLPCSGKSHLTKQLVRHLGRDHAARLPMDHYFLDATRSEHIDQHSMLVYQRDRLDWTLLLGHLEQLVCGQAINTPRYDWEHHRRVPMSSCIGHTCHIDPVPLVFVDGLHPSHDSTHKHIYVAPSWETRRRLIRIRSKEMMLPDGYEAILKQVEESPFEASLSWLATHCWKRVDNPIGMNLNAFCCECGWDRIMEPTHLDGLHRFK